MFKKLLATEHVYFTLPVRLALGVIFFAHGGQLMFGWFGGPGLSGTIQGFQQGLGFPPALAVLAAVAEFFGALGVLVGLLTRVAAAGISVVMLVAMFKVHWANGFFINWSMAPGVGHGIEMNLALLGLSVALLIAGGGALSLDRRLS